MRAIAIGTIVLAASALAQEEAATASSAGSVLHPRVTLETTLGDVVLELDGAKAPITVENFMRYCQDDFYDGLIFHRVMENFMIQGGGFKPDMVEKEEGVRPPISNEWRNGLKNKRGTISMARTNNPNSATCQFFINVVDNPALDGARSGGAGYAVFGKVVEGMDVVDRIRTTEVTEHPSLPMGKVVPAEPVIIQDTAIQGDWDVAAFQKAVAESQRQAWPGEVQEWVKKHEEQLGKTINVETSGLAWFSLQEGAGEAARPTSKVMTHYTGMFLSGEKFDSSVDRGQPFPVDLARPRVIQGWIETLATMKAGEKRLVLLPPDLAYGKRGSPPKIPGDAWLTFEIEAVSID